LIDLLAGIALQKSATHAQVALAWLLAKKSWIAPIPGTTKISRLEENVVAARIQLTLDEMTEIDRAFASIPVQGDRYPASLQSKVGK